MREMDILEVKVPPSSSGERLDRFLISHIEELTRDLNLSSFKGLSRSFIKRAIEKGIISLPGKPKVKPSYRLRGTETIQLNLTELEKELSGELDLKPVKLDLEILFEDPWILVVNKPKGLISHPASGTDDRPTLLNGVLHYLLERGINSRPLLVHRLDRDTTGCLMIAKDLRAYNLLKGEFKTYSRIYLFGCEGYLKGRKIRVEAPIWTSRENPLLREVTPGGKEAITEVYPLIRRSLKRRDLTIGLAKLRTGRTHQIRVHLSSIGCPIAGDKQYGSKLSLDGYMLHAWFLSFKHPITEERVTVEAPLPVVFREILKEEEEKTLRKKVYELLKSESD